MAKVLKCLPRTNEINVVSKALTTKSIPQFKHPDSGILLSSESSYWAAYYAVQHVNERKGKKQNSEDRLQLRIVETAFEAIERHL